MALSLSLGDWWHVASMAISLGNSNQRLAGCDPQAHGWQTQANLEFPEA